MIPSQGSGLLDEEKSPPHCQIQSSQKDKQPTSQMQLIDHSLPHNANDVASKNVYATEEQEMTMTLPCGDDSATGMAISCGSEDDASIFLGTSTHLKKVRHTGSLAESDTSPKSGGSSRRGNMSATPRLSLGSYSMPSLISINENHDAAFLVNESVTSFVEFGNESTVSFLDNSSRTTSGLDTSSRTTTSSHGKAPTVSYSSMPSLRSIQDNEDSQLLAYDADRSFGNSSSIESVFNNSFQPKSMMLPFMVDDNKPALLGVKVSYEGQRFAAESITKDIISPPPISKHLYNKNMEKRLQRWDALSGAVPLPQSTGRGTSNGSSSHHGAASGGPTPAGHLRPLLSRTNATTSIMASLKNDAASVLSSNSDLGSAMKVLGRPQAASQPALAVVDPGDGSIILPCVKSGSPSTAGDTRPAMVIRRPSVSTDPSDSFSSEGEMDEEDEEIPLR